LSAILDLSQSTQEQILAEIDALIDEPDIESYRDLLLIVRKLHAENLRWLKSATKG
jgi:hypothetical protein